MPGAQGGQSESVPTACASAEAVGTAQERLCPPYKVPASTAMNSTEAPSEAIVRTWFQKVQSLR